MLSSGLDRVPSNGNGSRPTQKPYRPSDEGIREWNPTPKPRGVIILTQRTSPSIRSAVGWLYPLEHYDQGLSLDPLSQYAELLFIMGSHGDPDRESVQNILAEARNQLTDPEYDRLRDYAELLAA